MLDVFSPMQPEARHEQRNAYRQFLAARDGTPDVERRTLTRREEGMHRYLKPLSRIRDMDRALFDAAYASFDPKRKIPPEMLLLVALVKVNAAEAFGVGKTYEKVYRRAVKNQDDLELLLLIEETYHTKILLSSAVLYGIEVSAPYDPPPGLRAIMAGIVFTPEFISRPLVMASEVVGTMSFLNLLYAAKNILKHDPELRDAVEERLIEVLVDEIGHISFNRMCLGPAGLAQARAFLPFITLPLNRTMPEFSALGVHISSSGAELVVAPGKLPDEIRKAAFIA